MNDLWLALRLRSTTGKPPDQQQEGAHKQRDEHALNEVVENTVLVDEV